jgi:hypothetical protein
MLVLQEQRVLDVELIKDSSFKLIDSHTYLLIALSASQMTYLRPIEKIQQYFIDVEFESCGEVEAE